jgi:hypothetical protein
VSFISHNFHDLESPKISEHLDLDIKILCWTIKNSTEARRSLEIATNITFEGFDPGI